MGQKGKRAALFLCFLLIGLLVFVFFSHIRPVLSGSNDFIGRFILMGTLLFASLLVRGSSRLNAYWPVLFAFFTAALAMFIDLYFESSLWLLKILKIPLQSPAGLALDKLDSSLIIVITILLFTKLSGNTFGSIFLQKGHLRRGLTIGSIAFLISLMGAVFMANTFGAQNLTLTRIIPWIPWILIFVLGNAFNEELLFRGLFLRKLEPLFGKLLSNLVLILPFVLHHTGVTYTNDTMMFLAYLIPLAFAWSAITQKTDSLLGSVMFHAGTDLPVILAIFSNLS